MRIITQGDFTNKRVLLRLDLDVPIADGRVGDLTRLLAAKKTVDFLKDKVSNLVICGHIGRPSDCDERLSTKLLVNSMNDVFGFEIEYIDNYWVEKFNSKFLLLENLRFWRGEEENSADFAKKLSNGMDLLVNDSFATSHRAVASTVAVSRVLESYAGLRMSDEITNLNRVLSSPDKPLVAIVGGAKIETKLPVINALSSMSDFVLVGGLLPKEIKEKGIRFASNVIVASLDSSGMDISSESVSKFEEKIMIAKEIVWNGPVGNFEDKRYSEGTRRIVECLMRSGARKTIGGGDTIHAVNQFGDLEKFDWVSLGGGAMLEFLAGNKLPGINALES